MHDCPCGSGRKYEQCCGLYLDEGVPAETAEALMRSRYTAHCKENLGYLFRTWHPETRPGHNALNLQKDILWTGLEIISTEAGRPGDEQGMVEFVAQWVSSGQTLSMHEKSRFVCQEGQWLYVDGDVRQERPTPVKVGRNDLCPCGSGRKYKKCCSP